MRVAVYYSNKDVRVEQRALPTIGDDEVLLKVEASGICGSDVMEWYRLKTAPRVLGHEVAGIIEECGSKVKRFSPGDRVTVSHHVPCNTCRYCLEGNHTVCDTLRSTNFDPGGFSEYVRVPAINVDRGIFPLPSHVSFEEATFVEPLGCVVRGFRLAQMGPAKSLLVIGSGISGLLHIKLARALGADFIVATDIHPYRLSVAEKCGADLVVRAGERLKDKIIKRFGRLCDIVVLCAAADSAIKEGLECVERAGTVVFFAPKRPGEMYTLELFPLWRDNITVRNTYAAAPVDSQIALDLIASGRVVVKDLITHVLPMDEIQEGFRLVEEAGESVKVIIRPNI